VQVQINQVKKIIDDNKATLNGWFSSWTVANLVIKSHGRPGAMQVNDGDSPALQIQSPSDINAKSGFDALKSIVSNKATILQTACDFLDFYDSDKNDGGFADYWTGSSNRTLYMNTIRSGSMGYYGLDPNGESILIHGGRFNFDRELAFHNWDSTKKHKGYLMFNHGKMTLPVNKYKQIKVNKQGGFKTWTK
jgi:hypothetical protein